MAWNKDTRNPHPTDGAPGADPENLREFGERIEEQRDDRTAPGGSGLTSEDAASEASDPTGYGGAAAPDVRAQEARRAFGDDANEQREGEPPATSS